MHTEAELNHTETDVCAGTEIVAESVPPPLYIVSPVPRVTVMDDPESLKIIKASPAANTLLSMVNPADTALHFPFQVVAAAPAVA